MDPFDSQQNDEYGGGEDEGLISDLRRIADNISRAPGMIDPLASVRSEVTLGDDILDIRRAAAAAAAKRGTGTGIGIGAGIGISTGIGASPAATPIDLNEEKNLADLEDPGLKQHMLDARKRLAAREQELDRLPSVQLIVAEDTAARRAMSSLMTLLNEEKMALQCAIEEANLNESNLKRLVAGEKPHGYPRAGKALGDEHPDLAKNLNHLASRMAATAKAFAQSLTQVEEFERGLTLARRNYETVVSGYSRRTAHYEATQKEMAAIYAAKAETAATVPATVAGPVPVPATVPATVAATVPATVPATATVAVPAVESTTAQ